MDRLFNSGEDPPDERRKTVEGKKVLHVEKNHVMGGFGRQRRGGES